MTPAVRPKLSLWKKILFGSVVTLCFLFSVELLLFVCGVTTASFRDDPYVGFASYAPLYVTSADAVGTERRETASGKLRWFNQQAFPGSKPAGTYRIFCVGGSTTYGRPYDDHTSFAGWLREFLPVADDRRTWEVINAGGISYASYRVAKLMEELIEYEPDLFIVYCGHNEFLERRTYADIIATPTIVRDLETVLGKTRTYSLIRQLIKRRSGQGEVTRDTTQISAEVESILDDAVGPEVYTRDLDLQADILSHYRFNLNRMADMVQSVGAEVIFVVPAANLRDCAPFRSQPSADLPETEQFRRLHLYNRASAALENGQWAEAFELAEQAEKIDEQVAAVHYVRGRALWGLRRYDEAKVAFCRARDEDICPLRALTRMTEIVRQTADEQQLPVVDFVQLVADRAEHGVPGNDWFLDHVHPTVAGNRLLALALVDTMKAERILQLQPSWNETAIQRVVKQVESRINPLAHAEALKNLSKVLAWAGKREEAQQLALRAVQLLPDDAEALYQAGSAYLDQGDPDQAIQSFRDSLSRRPNYARAHFGLAKAYRAKQEIGAAAEHYELAIDLDPQFEDAHYNLARLYERSGKVPHAIRHYQAALQINPDHFYSQNNLGSIYARRQEFDAAAEHFRLAIAAKPNFAHAQFNLGVLEQLRDHPQQAADSFRAALRSRPDHFAAAFHLAQLLATHPNETVRNGEEAVFWAKRLAQSTEMETFWEQVEGRNAGFQRSDVLSVLAAAYAEAGDFEQAILSQQTAAELLPLDQRGDSHARLERFKAGIPFRQSARP